ncbi:MAG: serine/threonine protein kinase [Planctomycetota bacterium]|jgi:serine/threonine protein kinase
MTSTRTRDPEAIFTGALERTTAGERAAFLDGACAGDAGLRDRVEVLLGAHEGAGTFLHEPALGGVGDVTLAASPLTERPGTMIGPYKLLQLIGEGGFGAVYMAEQRTPVKRKVALKIIKLGMDTRQVIARFEAERQALALMDHPNIARVLDAGATDTGRPYFVMELVKGVPITEYCDTNNLSTEQRLDLFVLVCMAVQHAHQKGIIHRDIKPSNVMITLHDGQPVPKVIDFGIAKATNRELTDKTLFTEYRQFIGTPEYMSPEQAEMSGLDIDTRSDIYALGVLLYELLTGTTPFDSAKLRSAAYGEIHRIIREEEPHKPSTRVSTLGEEVTDIARHRRTDARALNRELQGDLDWITMKAMEKDRTRRYETANGLAMDIRRHVADEPVLATPPSPAYRMRKFVRRNRTAVTGGGVIAAALVLGLAFASLGLVSAKRSEAVAQTQAANAAALSGFLQEMLASVDPAFASGGEFTLVTMLEDAGEKLDAGVLADQVEIEADMRSTIGRTYMSLGLNVAAEPHLQRAVDIRREHLGVEHPDTLDVMDRLARTMDWQGRPFDAEPLFRTVYETRIETLGEDHGDTLQALYYLAWNSFDRGHEEEGEKLHLQCLERRRKVFGEDHELTAGSWNCSGLTHVFREQYDEAEPYIAKAYEIGMRALGEGNPDTLLYARNLANVHIHQQRYDEAETLLTTAIPVSRRVLGPAQRRTTGLIRQLMRVYADQGRQDEARPWVVQVIDARKRRCESAPSNPSVLNDYAWLLLTCEIADLQAPAEALEVSLKANVLTDHQNPDYVDTLALAYFRTGDVGNAIVYGRQAVALLPDGHEDRAELETRLAEYEQAAAEPAS